MYHIHFYQTIPVIETIVCLIFGLIISIKMIRKIKHKTVGLNLNFIKSIALLFLGILMLFRGLYAAFLCCNPHKTVLFTLTEVGILFPVKPPFCAPEKLIIPWKNVTQIHLKEYSTFSYIRRRRRVHHHTYLYFNYVDSSGKSSIESIDFKCLAASPFIFFAEVRKFYSGPIYKETDRGCGKFQILKTLADNQLWWDNIESIGPHL